MGCLKGRKNCWEDEGNPYIGIGDTIVVIQKIQIKAWSIENKEFFEVWDSVVTGE